MGYESVNARELDITPLGKPVEGLGRPHYASFRDRLFRRSSIYTPKEDEVLAVASGKDAIEDSGLYDPYGDKILRITENGVEYLATKDGRIAFINYEDGHEEENQEHESFFRKYKVPIAAAAMFVVGALGAVDYAHGHDIKKISRIMPQLADGGAPGSSIASTISIVNIGDATNIFLKPYNSDGTPMELTIDGVRGTSFPYSLARGGSLVARTSGEGQTKVGYLLVENSNGTNLGASLGYAYNITGQQQILSVPAMPLSSMFTFPAAIDRDGNLQTLGDNPQQANLTGVAVVNVNDFPIRVEAELISKAGLLLDKASFTLQQNSHLARYVHEQAYFPNRDNIEGSISMRFYGPDNKPALSSVLALQQIGSSFKTTPTEPFAVDVSAAAQVSGLVATLGEKALTGQSITIEADGRTYSGITNSLGRYMVSLAGNAGTAKVRIDGGKEFYHWEKVLPATNFETAAPGVFLMTRVQDPDSKFAYNPDAAIDPSRPPEFSVWTPSDQPMEKLDLLKWMHFDQVKKGCGTGDVVGWAEYPIKIYLDPANAPQGQLTAARQALQLGTTKNLFREVDSEPAQGLRVKWNAASTEYRTTDGVMCGEDRKKGEIHIKNVVPDDIQFWQKAFAHELGHALGLGLGVHMISQKHIMFGTPLVQDYSAIENSGVLDIVLMAKLKKEGRLYKGFIYDFRK